MAITPEQARAELARRELAKRQSKPMFSSEEEGRVAISQQSQEQEQLKANASPMGLAKETASQTAQDVVGGAYTAANTASVGGLDATMGLITGKSQLSQPGSAGYDVAQGAGMGVGMIAPMGMMGTSAKAVTKTIKYETELQQAAKAKTALDGIRSTLGKAKSIAISGVDNISTDVSWNLKSQRAFNAMKNPVYQIKFEQGTNMPVQTVGNMDKVKEALGDLIGSPQMWEEAPKKEIQHVKQIYGEINQAMKTAADKTGKPISQALDAYSEFMDKYHLVNKTVVDKAGNAMGNYLKETFKSTAEPALQEAWKDVSKMSPEIKSVMASMKNRELLRKILQVSPWVAGTGAAALTGGKALSHYLSK